MYQMQVKSLACIGTETVFRTCEPWTEEELVALYVCAHELLTVECIDFEIGAGIPTCDQLIESNALAY